MADHICIVDDDASVRESLTEFLEAAGFLVSQFSSAIEFLASEHCAICKCLITDVRMPDMDGLTLQDELVRRGRLFPVIVITGHGDVPLAVRAMRAGAVDFIEKPFTPDTMLASVQRALQAHTDRNVNAIDHLVADRLKDLTEREREVLDLVVLGHPNKVIAQKLSISFRTVEVHRARVLSKMKVQNVAELVRLMLSGTLSLDEKS